MPKYLYLYTTFPSKRIPFEISINWQTVIPSRTKSLKKSLFLYHINEWNNLNTEFRNAKSIKFLKKIIVTEHKENSLFSVYDPLGVKLLTQLRLQFSHLNEHKFRHGFGDAVSCTCGCNAGIEDTEHLLLCCQFYSIQRLELFNNINKIARSFL